MHYHKISTNGRAVCQSDTIKGDADDFEIENNQFVRVCDSFFNNTFMFGNLEQRIWIYYAV